MLRVIFAPIRFTVFFLLGVFVMFGINNCVPEKGDIGIPERSENPPQKWEKSY